MLLVSNKKQNIKYVLLLLLYNFEEIGTFYYGEKHQKMKNKIMKMDKELVLETIRNVKRVDHFKEEYQEMAGYEVGSNFYDIRKRYGRMVHVYLATHSNYNVYPYETFMFHLDEMHHLAIEISHFVEMIFDFEKVTNYSDIEHEKRMKRLNVNKTIEEYLERQKAMNKTLGLRMGRVRVPTRAMRRAPKWKSGSTRWKVGRDFLNNDGGAFDSDDAHDILDDK